MDIREKAEKLHKSGFNCAQSVLGACGEYTGLDENTALAVSAGFGGEYAAERSAGRSPAR